MPFMLMKRGHGGDFPGCARHPGRGRRLSLDLSVDAVSMAGLCRLFHQRRRHRLLSPHRADDCFVALWTI
ncbi:hypothetical protein B296_00028966 [Ensete ventricosum]|uniref:Uncharacterized protein n=1 Tax=Ensete ventricosum TaxID=4639 RepID=A0A427AAC5_ENSVE|nr:hypothetical protein B296_00028966 [Ensete ventricosum]